MDFIDLNLHGTGKESNLITNQLELFFQEIEIAIKTMPNTIWGIDNYLNIHRYVFNTYVSLSQIKNEILNYISNNCSCADKFQYDLSIQNLKGEVSDVIYIIMKVNGQDYDGHDKEFIQKYIMGYGKE